MKYYFLKSFTGKGSGCFPHTETVPFVNMDYNQFTKWTVDDDDKKIELKPLVLRKCAKMHDLLKTAFIQSTKSLIISSAFYELLGQFNIGKHINIALKVKNTKGETADYQLFKSLNNFIEHIDIANSEFVIYNYQDNKTKDIKLNSQQLYDCVYWNNSIIKYPESLMAQKIKMKESFNYDLFHFETMSGSFLVSERLRKSIGNSKLKGIDFKEPIDSQVLGKKFSIS